MFLSSQHQTSAVETEDAAHAFDLLDLFLCICCCLASLVPVSNLWSRYISCSEPQVEVHQRLLDLPVQRAITYHDIITCNV